MNKMAIGIATFLSSLVLAVSAWALPFNSVYVFGDSLSDAGSNPSAVLSIYKILGTFYSVPGVCDPGHPCPPYVDGHYSNGPTAAEYLANAILPGGANPGNFFSFAVSGATSGIGNYGDGGNATTAGAFTLPGMARELGLYQTLSSGVADPNALYFVWGGANDLLTGDNPVFAAQRIAGYVGALAGMGASHLLVPNLPDLSLTPYVQNQGASAVAFTHAFSVAFNNELAMQINGLDLLFPSVDIIGFDTFSFLNDVVANPANYGFANSTTACLPSLLDVPCVYPDEYVFWDDFHPTTQAHAVIAAAFARAVPEPGTLALLAMGLLVLITINLRRRPLPRPVITA